MGRGVRGLVLPSVDENIYEFWVIGVDLLGLR